MSRVYTENILEDVAKGTAAYITAFRKALASTRIAFEAPPHFGGSLLDFFLNFFGTSDPYIGEEVDLTAAWSVAPGDSGNFFGPGGGDSKLHLIQPSFKAAWPPPAKWVHTVDWHPLTQTNPRHRHFGRYRSRRSRVTAEAG